MRQHLFLENPAPSPFQLCAVSGDNSSASTSISSATSGVANSTRSIIDVLPLCVVFQILKDILVPFLFHTKPKLRPIPFHWDIDEAGWLLCSLQAPFSWPWQGVQEDLGRCPSL